MPPSSTARSHRRPCVAVLLDRMNLVAGGFEAEIRGAFVAAAGSADVDVVFVYGRSLAAGDPEDAAHNLVYERLRRERIDAVVVVATALSPLVGVAGLRQYLERLCRFPIVSLGLALPGIPSVVVDGRAGITAIVEHLVTHHGRRAIAFLGGVPGNPEADARLAAFREVHERHGLTLDPERIEFGYFSQDRGGAALERILARGLEIDAVVAANDTMAFGALDALRRRGGWTAARVSVTGFDDVASARAVNPPLTTVAQPFRDLVDAALRLALAELVGEPPAALVEVMPLVRWRASCGCARAPRPRRFPVTPADPADVRARLGATRPGLEGRLALALDAGAPGDSAARALLDALFAEIAGTKGAWLDGLERLVQQAPADGRFILGLQHGVTELANVFGDSPVGGIGDLWHEAQEHLAQAASAAHMQHVLAVHSLTLSLATSGEVLTAAVDPADLAARAAAALTSLRIRGARLTTLAPSTPNPPTPPPSLANQLTLLLSFADGARVADEGPCSPATALFPPEPPEPAQSRATLLFPLTAGDDLIGLAAFEYDAGTSGYSLLRDQLATALRNALLRHAMLEATLRHERFSQERAATQQRLDALRILAGSVAHDINNALGPLALWSEMIRRELPEGRPLPPEGVERVRRSAERIQTSTLQAAQVVQDLLSLGRRGHGSRVLLELSSLVAGRVEGERARLAHRIDRLEVHTELWSEALPVQAVEAQVARAVDNLLRNAVEACEHGGTVRVATRREHLATSRVGYEDIPAGEYAVVAVSDTGSGIEKSDLPRIFEPYYSGKQMAAESGTGLGLAIVHGVVKEFDGFVEVISEPGRGATFEIYLPLVSSGRPASPRAPG